MPRDSRWGFLPLIILRPAQLVLAVICLALNAYLVAAQVPVLWWGAFGLVTSLIALGWSIAVLVLFFRSMLLPLAVLIVDAVLVVFYLISFAGAADGGGVQLPTCEFTDGYGIYSYDTYIYIPCVVSKASFAFELIAFFTYIPTLVFAAITMHHTRGDLHGKKHRAQVQNESITMAPVGAAEQGGAAEYKEDYTQYQQYPQQQPTPVYDPHAQNAGTYQQPPQEYAYQSQQAPMQPYVSPPSSPPPVQQQMQQPPTGGAPANTVNAVPAGHNTQEMPSYSPGRGPELQG